MPGGAGSASRAHRADRGGAPFSTRLTIGSRGGGLPSPTPSRDQGVAQLLGIGYRTVMASVLRVFLRLLRVPRRCVSPSISRRRGLRRSLRRCQGRSRRRCIAILGRRAVRTRWVAGRCWAVRTSAVHVDALQLFAHVAPQKHRGGTESEHDQQRDPTGFHRIRVDLGRQKGGRRCHATSLSLSQPPVSAAPRTGHSQAARTRPDSEQARSPRSARPPGELPAAR
jgi:hypothetical protein